jgi:hypothetical protein
MQPAVSSRQHTTAVRRVQLPGRLCRGRCSLQLLRCDAVERVKAPREARRPQPRDLCHVAVATWRSTSCARYPSATQPPAFPPPLQPTSPTFSGAATRATTRLPARTALTWDAAALLPQRDAAAGCALRAMCMWCCGWVEAVHNNLAEGGAATGEAMQNCLQKSAAAGGGEVWESSSECKQRAGASSEGGRSV